MLYKAYFSTFQSLCQVSQEDSLRGSQFPNLRILQDLEPFSQRNAPGVSFLCWCIHVNTLFHPSCVYFPLPQKAIFRQWNYVEFGEVRIVWVCVFWGWVWWLGCSSITIRRHLPKRERIAPLPTYKPMPTLNTQTPGIPPHSIPLCQVEWSGVEWRPHRSGRNLAGLWRRAVFT